MTTPEDIFDCLLEHTSALTLPHGWERIMCHPSFRAFACDRDKLLAKMLEKFGRERLHTAGVVTADAEGKQVLHPKLSEPGGIVVALRRDPDQAPFNILTARGCLCEPRLPVCAVLQDAACRRMLNEDSWVYFTFTLADMAVLWSVGVPAAPVLELDRLTGQDIEVFCEAMGWHRRWTGDNPVGFSDVRNEITPVVVVWSPAAFDLAEPAGAPGVCQHLSNLQQHMHLPLDECLLWRPTDEAMASVRFCAGHANASSVREALLASAEAHSELLGEDDTVGEGTVRGDRAAEDWIEVECADYAKLGHAENRRRRRALRLRHVIEPLLRDAATFSDPLARNLAVSVADLSRVLHAMTMNLVSEFEATIALQHESRGQLQDVLRLVDHLLRISKELHEWDYPKVGKSALATLRARRRSRGSA